MAQPGDIPWTDDELRASVEGYLYLLRLEQIGVQYKEAAAGKVLREGPLANRNEGSIRYRMRNISAVVRDKGGPILSAYSPAAQVGAGVRARIAEMLNTHPIFLDIVSFGKSAAGLTPISAVDKASLLQKLNILRGNLDELERELVGIGHNRPPEPIEPGAPHKKEIDVAKSAVDDLSAEISKQTPDPDVVANRSRVLTDFGLRVAVWMGARATKFVDAAVTAAAPVAVIAATGLLPNLIDVTRDIWKFMGLL